MDLKEAITVAIALKCLILMVASQSEETGACFDASKEVQACGTDEFVKLTVLSRKHITSRRKYDDIQVRYDVAFKSEMGITDGLPGYLEIPEGHACAPNLIPDSQFVLIANYIDHSSDAIQLCTIKPEVMSCHSVEILFVMKDSTTS